MHLIGSPPVCTKAREWGVGLPKALTAKQEEDSSRNAPAMMRMMKVSDDAYWFGGRDVMIYHFTAS